MTAVVIFLTWFIVAIFIFSILRVVDEESTLLDKLYFDEFNYTIISAFWPILLPLSLIGLVGYLIYFIADKLAYGLYKSISYLVKEIKSPRENV